MIYFNDSDYNKEYCDYYDNYDDYDDYYDDDDY